MTSQVWGWTSHLSEIPLARETGAMVHLNFAQTSRLFLENGVPWEMPAQFAASVHHV
jgi:hypothetical protein